MSIPISRAFGKIGDMLTTHKDLSAPDGKAGSPSENSRLNNHILKIDKIKAAPDVPFKRRIGFKPEGA